MDELNELAMHASMDLIRKEFASMKGHFETAHALHPSKTRVDEATDLAIAMTRWMETLPDLQPGHLIVALSMLVGTLLRSQDPKTALAAAMIIATMKEPNAPKSKA